MSKFLVRCYEKGDEYQLVDLLTNAFHEWPDRDTPDPLDFWRWKYEGTIKGINLIAVVLDGDKIIGSNHGYHHNVKVGNDVYLCAVASDLAVHPDYRRMGVSKLLSEQKGHLEKEAGIDLAYWVTENEIIIRNNREKKINPVFPHKLVEYTWINDIHKHLKATDVQYKNLKNIGYTLMKKIQSFNVSSSQRNDNNIEVNEIARFESKLDDLWNSEKINYDFAIERRQEYLNWRYCDPRAGEYKIFQAEINSMPVGYIAVRINRFKADYPTGYIIDIFSKTDPMIYDLLIGKALGFLQECEVNVVRYRGVEGSLIIPTLKTFGFLDLGQGAPEVILSSKSIIENWEKFMNTERERLLFHIGDTEFM